MRSVGVRTHRVRARRGCSAAAAGLVRLAGGGILAPVNPLTIRAAASRGVALSITLALSVIGCGGSGDDCVSTREFFAREVWAEVLAKRCLDCHGPGGVAEQEGAALLLLPASYPGFLDADFAAASDSAKVSHDGVPALLAKPTGRTKHGGGAVITEGGREYRILQKLLAQLEEPVECAEDQGAGLEDVALLGPEETLRKAALHLVGRLPDADERAAVADGGEDALEDVLRGMLAEDAFYERLGDIFNDLLLTDRYLLYPGFAVDLLDEADFPNAGAWWESLAGQDALREQVNRAVAREPIDLMRYIVRNDRPFTEVLTADYTVLNPFSAKLYGALLTFDDPSDPGELQVARLTSARGGLHALPHAGVLSSPMFLNRYPTTPTNRNRHRARVVFELFLATDVLRIGERPIDPTQSLQYQNPTRDDVQCNFCHKLIDPVAGAFQNYDDVDQEVFGAGREWYAEMYAPGFAGEDMPKSEFPESLQWFAARAAADPRFSAAAVRLVYRALTGQEPLRYPEGGEDPLYLARLAAWQAQDAAFTRIGERFVADDHDLKTIFVELILSAYYRGVDVDEVEASEESDVRLAAVGTGRLSPPELLAAKIHAVTGVRWLRPWDLREWLAADYELLYGGIDSDTITERVTRINAVMAGVAARMANEVACAATAYDLSRPAESRALLPKVALDTVPEGAGVKSIRDNIRHLHARVLGEALADDDPEIERTYALFVDTWKEGAAAVAAGKEPAQLPYDCQARVDPNTQVALPEAEQLVDDERYTVRAWMAVLTYLLSDYAFLYE